MRGSIVIVSWAVQAFPIFSHENNVRVEIQISLVRLSACTVQFNFYDGMMDPARLSVAFARFILRFVEVLVTRPRLPRASVWCDIALPLLVMIITIERRGYLQPPYENIPARCAFLMSHRHKKRI